MVKANPKKLIGYIRVSTDKQERSGLGLKGQEAAIAKHVQENGAVLLASFREVESGKSAERPELLKAVARAKREGATLVIAKMDRLSRNVAFLSTLMDSGLNFVACDNPHANRLTVQILSVIAEDEARRISQRTKDALAAYKADGGLLGASRPECRNLTQEAREKGAEAAAKARKQYAVDAYSDLLPVMQEMKAAGNSLQAIADRLNADGQRTRKGADWTATQVLRALRRAS